MGDFACPISRLEFWNLSWELVLMKESERMEKEEEIGESGECGGRKQNRENHEK